MKNLQNIIERFTCGISNLSINISKGLVNRSNKLVRIGRARLLIDKIINFKILVQDR